ncbi:amidase [Paenibacillus sp. EPM92]|uniref:amidase n=1 Tax=Paenibacillus sp. EPM92 TaxID=1561195 RepID=UPI001916C0FD|nr:amidase [Paenibacillus sp. EPM92]
MYDLFFETISSVASSLKKKEISPVELTTKLLERIERLEPTLNAFITVLSDDALTQAKLLEQELQQGNVRGPLHGVPIAIKDVFETKDRITTAGSKIFESWKPDKDAAVIQCLKDAGAIIIGKNNLHEFCAGSTTENPHYGQTRNPWDVNKIPGGSSGGSAVAVATGMCFGAVGTDTTGSVRLPSSICGVVGLKPTYEVVSREGLVPLSWTFDHIGPISRTVEDSAIMLSVMADKDKLGKLDLNLSFQKDSLYGVRIGVCDDYFFEHMDPEMKDIVHTAIQKLQDLGAEIIEINLPNTDQALEAQKTIAKSEAYSFHKPMFDKYPERYGKDLNVRLNSGKEVTASEYLQAQRFRRRFIDNALHTLRQCDIIVSPTNVIVPYDIGTIPPEKTINNIFNLGKTAIASFLGFPAITVPCGFTRQLLPVGMQLIGKPYSEGLLLEVGSVYEKSENWVDYLRVNRAYEKPEQLKG